MYNRQEYLPTLKENPHCKRPSAVRRELRVEVLVEVTREIPYFRNRYVYSIVGMHVCTFACPIVHIYIYIYLFIYLYLYLYLYLLESRLL